MLVNDMHSYTDNKNRTGSGHGVAPLLLLL